MLFYLLQWDIDWVRLLQVISIDIVLSGDNALIIAMATKNLEKRYQNRAIFIGVAGAIVLRILFASGIIYLLRFPFIYLIGGLLLIWIGYKILIKKEENPDISSHHSLYRAILTIISADLVMSLDNVVAIAGASAGNIPLLAIGVIISIPLMVFGAKFIVILLKKFPSLMYVGSAILVYTGADMIVHEEFIIQLFQIHHAVIPLLFSCILTLAVILTGYITNREAT
ncbi:MULTISPECIES: TerC family protein [Gracilibacillus]|uniref:TerC family protein n=1 Tax=Gracilibacillus TaxID=74385 RepID=UPI000A686FD8|nr:TerC family protein [Gracilibacillus dipsosauri]